MKRKRNKRWEERLAVVVSIIMRLRAEDFDAVYLAGARERVVASVLASHPDVDAGANADVPPRDVREAIQAAVMAEEAKAKAANRLH